MCGVLRSCRHLHCAVVPQPRQAAYSPAAYCTASPLLPWLSNVCRQPSSTCHLQCCMHLAWRCCCCCSNQEHGWMGWSTCLLLGSMWCFCRWPAAAVCILFKAMQAASCASASSSGFLLLLLMSWIRHCICHGAVASIAGRPAGAPAAAAAAVVGGSPPALLVDASAWAQNVWWAGTILITCRLVVAATT